VLGGEVVGGVDVGVELGAEVVGGGLAAVELTDREGDGDGDAALGMPVVEELGVGLVEVGGAASRATVAATGSDEGKRRHRAALVVPCCMERVDAAT
jgi:hypothetical protein